MEKNYHLIFLLLLLIQIQAQTTEINAQSVSRAAASFSSAGKSKIQNQQIITGPDKTFTMDQIVNWTGKGSKRAAMVVQWNDGKQPDAMVWGYRWDGNANAADMIKAIAQADPRFFLLIREVETQVGVKSTEIGGIGYKLNQENPFKLTVLDFDQIDSDGIFTYVFAFSSVWNRWISFYDWKCNNSDNHWSAASDTVAWIYLFRYSNIGNYITTQTPTQREITNNSWSGFWYGRKQEGKDTITYFPNSKLSASPVTDYTKGVFFLNDNNVGQDNGTLNYLDRYGEFSYDIYRKKNNKKGSTFGIKSVFATIFDGKLFVISKKYRRVVVADPITLESIASIDVSPYKREADGRAFVGITPELGYISTSNGICAFNLKTYRIGEYIPGTDGETGNMVLAANYVFAVQRNRVLILKDNAVVSTISGCNYSSVCQSKDRMVWIAAGSVLIKVDPNTLEQTRFMLPHHAKIGHSWDAWNAGSFCASTQKNALYWTNSDLFNAGKDVYCYQIDDPLSLMVPIYTLPQGQRFYGVGIRVDPVTNLLYITSTRNNLFNFDKNWVHVVDAATGKTIKDYELNVYNWFPAMPIFPVVSSVAPHAMEIVNKNKTTENHAKVKQNRAYRSGDRLFNLPVGAVIEAYNMSGALSFKVKADHSEFKIPQKGFLIFNIISEDGIQVIR